MEKILYSWSFDTTQEKGILWYIIVFSVAIGLIVWGFLTKQYGMSLMIILLSGFYFYVENNSSSIFETKIKEEGISIGDSFYPYSNIDKYCFVYEGKEAILLRLKIIKKIGIQNMDININNDIVKDIKNILNNFIEEKETEELSLYEKLLKRFKL